MIRLESVAFTPARLANDEHSRYISNTINRQTIIEIRKDLEMTVNDVATWITITTPVVWLMHNCRNLRVKFYYPVKFYWVEK